MTARLTTAAIAALVIAAGLVATVARVAGT